MKLVISSPAEEAHLGEDDRNDASGHSRAQGFGEGRRHAECRGPYSELYLVQSGPRAGGIDRHSPRRTIGGQLLPRTLVTVLLDGAEGSTGIEL